MWGLKCIDQSLKIQKTRGNAGLTWFLFSFFLPNSPLVWSVYQEGHLKSKPYKGGCQKVSQTDWKSSKQFRISAFIIIGATCAVLSPPRPAKPRSQMMTCPQVGCTDCTFASIKTPFPCANLSAIHRRRRRQRVWAGRRKRKFLSFHRCQINVVFRLGSPSRVS